MRTKRRLRLQVWKQISWLKAVDSPKYHWQWFYVWAINGKTVTKGGV